MQDAVQLLDDLVTGADDSLDNLLMGNVSIPDPFYLPKIKSTTKLPTLIAATKDPTTPSSDTTKEEHQPAADG